MEVKYLAFRHSLGDASAVDVVDDCERLRAFWRGINPQRLVAYPERLTVVRESLNSAGNVNTAAVARPIVGRFNLDTLTDRINSPSEEAYQH
jgi:hypothetical protein